jgi:hypothetical protein
MESQAKRRIHSADVKAAVLAECQEPGASVAAVAALEFVPVGLSGSARGAAEPERTSSGDIGIDLQHGNARLTVHWPSAIARSASSKRCCSARTVSSRCARRGWTSSNSSWRA